MKKSALVLVFIILLGVCSCGEGSFGYKESPVEDFLYEMEDGEVVITGYKGTDREIYIPAKINDRPVTVIGEEAFKEYDMTHITMPDSVTVIESSAFNHCECLTTISFSNKSEKIYDYAFSHCDKLENVSLPNTALSLSEGVFYGCDILSNVVLPDSLESIGVAAFAECTSLTHLNIPDNTNLNLSFSNYKGVSLLSSPIAYSARYKDQTTIMVVKNGSNAHEQLKEYEKYGLKFEVK